MDVSADVEFVELAGKGRRFANLVIDSLAQYTVLFIVAFAVALTAPQLGDAVIEHSFIFSIGVMLFYYVACESLFGRTVGKLITGTRVVTESGDPPSLPQVFGRTLARLVPFEPFSCLGDPPVGWHDGWSGTRVVRTTLGNTAGPAFSLKNSGDDGSSPSSLGLR
jgi:uncharacterized RDD family membrane protein YckC